jgi:hypothetical protein
MSSALFNLLKKLDQAKIRYYIERHRADTIDITATIVGQRIEISVFDDDHIEVSRFVGHEEIEDEGVLLEIIDREIKEEEAYNKLSPEEKSRPRKFISPDPARTGWLNINPANACASQVQTVWSRELPVAKPG